MKKWNNHYKIVSFYTPDYAEHAEGLIESIRKHLPKQLFEIEPIDMMTWQGATDYKGQFMYEKLKKTDRPLVWIDVDALITGPDLTFPQVDFAIYARFADRLRHRCSPFRTGTVYFGTSKEAQLLVQAWRTQCGPGSDTDQWALWKAWMEVMRNGEMPATFWLPLSYCQKINEEGSEPPKIVHTMASRTLRKKK